MKVPFGFHKNTNRYIGIDEAKNGLACGCICPSCKMQLKARQGDENEHHFAHHKKAKIKCEFSYWVAVRSMAKQLIEKYKFVNVDYKNENLFAKKPFNTIFIDSVKMNPRIKSQQFDLEVTSSIGVFYIYLLTDKEDSGRYRNHYRDRHKYFETKLVLEIDLSTMKKSGDKAAEYLNDLLFIQSLNKSFLAPCQYFMDYERISLVKHEEKKRQYVSSQSSTPNQAILYIKSMLDIANNDEEYISSILATIKAMEQFYNEGILASLKIHHNTNLGYFNIIYRKNQQLFFGAYARQYFAIVFIETRFLIYRIDEGSVHILCETNNTKDVHISINNYFMEINSVL
jgi:hypothetical protein